MYNYVDNFLLHFFYGRFYHSGNKQPYLRKYGEGKVSQTNLQPTLVGTRLNIDDPSYPVQFVYEKLFLVTL